jgi:hypothetical protein
MAAALAIYAAAATSALAVAPQFGRCVRTKAGGSGYANAGCTAAAESGAKYQWLPGPGAKAHFSASGGSAGFETTAGAKIECGSASSAGEYTGLQTQELTITFSGCRLEGVACQSGATAGEIVSAPLQGRLGLVLTESDPMSNEAGIGMYPPADEPFAQFECGATAVTISGAVIHQVKVNKMLAGEPQKLKLYRAGEQKPESFDTPWEDPLIAEPVAVLETSIEGGAASQTGLLWLSTLSNEEKLEVNTTV